MMPNAEEPLPFGALLRQWRLAANLTQEALAERTGLGVRSIQHLEGGAHRPHRETVQRLLRVLGLTGEERREFERMAQPTPRPRETASVSSVAVPGDDAHPRAPRHNLPAPLTSFVGRASEIEEIDARLRSVRLLTLTGTGGCGKTRLALAVAERLVSDYPDGVWVAELAALSDPQLVSFAMASAVGLQTEPGQPVEQTLLAALRPRQLLLVLDNCEHLIEECARLATTLLRGCPALRILATSREALGVAGEVAWRVPSLPVPPRGQLPPDLEDPAALTQFAGVGLFVARAQLVAPGFTLSAPNAPAVAQICWRLDGMPLAIELAAARVKVLTPEQIAGRLDDQFRLLTGGSRTAVPRQQTLRATIDWSYQLLSELERRLLRRLAVFAGSWSVEAAEAMGAGEGSAGGEVLDLLTQLVDKSLVQVETQERAQRYRLLETLRQYGRDRLGEAGETEVARDRHRDWFLELAERAEPELIGPRQVEWLDRLEAEQDNFRAALAWCLDRGEARLALRLAGALWRLWHVRDYTESEGSEWLRRVLGAPGAEEPTAARAKALQGVWELNIQGPDHTGELQQRAAEGSLAICRTLGDRAGAAWSMQLIARHADDARAEVLLTQAFTLAQEAGSRWVMAQVLEALGIRFLKRDDVPMARRHLEESLALFRELGDWRAIAWSAMFLGIVAGTQGDLATARTRLTEALGLSRELRSRARIALLLLQLAALARIAGQYDEASGFVDECSAISREIGTRWLQGLGLTCRGLLARAEGDYLEAGALTHECLILLRDTDNQTGVVECLRLRGILAVEGGAIRRGVCLLGAADHQGGFDQGWLRLQEDRDAYSHCIWAARTALGKEAFATAYAEGQAMTLERAIARALEGNDA